MLGARRTFPLSPACMSDPSKPYWPGLKPLNRCARACSCCLHAALSPPASTACVRARSAELGRAGWGVLHTMAAAFPDQPSAVDQAAMDRFIYLFSRFYPCNMCAQTALQEMKRSPPVVTSGPDLHRWMCEYQNEVNERMGKPQFDCSLAMARWRGAPTAAVQAPVVPAAAKADAPAPDAPAKKGQ